MQLLICQDSSGWMGTADLVLTHPYAPLPKCLHHVPMILNLFEGKENRQSLAQGWIGGRQLRRIGTWGAGQQNTVYVSGLPPRDLPLLSSLRVDPPIYFPLGLPLMLLTFYSDLIRPRAVVWDGFMGRGTVGAACKQLGYGFIGIEKDPLQFQIAQRYLGTMFQ